MKRLLLVALLIVLCMLVVVAPASATILRGTFTNGTAYPQDPPDGIWPETPLIATGEIVIVPDAAVGVVARNIVVACDDPTVMPFPGKIQGMWVKWGPGEWDGDRYTVSGTWSRPPFYPPFEMTLEANPSCGSLFMRIDTIGSDWGWDHWDLYGTLD